MAYFRGGQRFRETTFSGLRLGVIIYPPAVLAERGFKMVFYDAATDVKKGELGTDIKEARISEVEFELMDFGCGAFSFKLDELPAFPINHRTRVTIHPYFDPVPWFMGFIQQTPKPGSKKPFEFQGFGFFDQLDWITVTGSYSAGQDVAEIVRGIVENIVAPNTQVVYNAAKIETTGYMTTGDIEFDHVFAKDALQMLADIAQNFTFGVDNSREFFFQAQSSNITRSLWHGKHFQDAPILVDPNGIRNKLYVRVGQIQAGGTNVVGNVSDDASIAVHGLREDIITAPEILDADDALQWAEYILSTRKDPITQAKVINFFLDQDKAKIEAEGRIRLTTEAGEEYTLPVKRVTYRMSAAGIAADLELGRLAVPFEQHVLDILRRIQEEQRLGDTRTKQLYT